MTAKVQLLEVPGDGGRHVSAVVTVDPPQAAEDAKWLTTTAWQGGGLVVDRLTRVREGVYRTNEPIPVYGDWKAEFRLHHGRSLLGVPVYLPDDPAIPAKEVPARASFERPFVRDKQILQREAKDGAGGLTLVGYAIVLAITLSIIALTRGRSCASPPSPTPRPPPAARSRRAASPPAPAGRRVSALERHELRLHGHPVAYYAAGSGPVVLLIHGITSSADAWRAVIPALAERHTVIAPDLLGHGGSAKPRGDYSLGAYASGAARPDGRARPPARDGRRPLDGRRHRHAARLPVPRARRAPRARLERRPRQGGRLVLRAATLPGAEWVLPLITRAGPREVIGAASG